MAQLEARAHEAPAELGEPPATGAGDLGDQTIDMKPAEESTDLGAATRLGRSSGRRGREAVRREAGHQQGGRGYGEARARVPSDGLGCMLAPVRETARPCSIDIAGFARCETVQCRQQPTSNPRKEADDVDR